MDAKRKRVIDLFSRKLRKVDIIKILEPENIGKRFIHRTIKRYQETGGWSIKKKTGRPRTIRTKPTIKKVRERYRRNPAQSARTVASLRT